MRVVPRSTTDSAAARRSAPGTNSEWNQSSMSKEKAAAWAVMGCGAKRRPAAPG